MAAVERVAASDPNPADPFRGLYISDERRAAAHAAATRLGRRRAARSASPTRSGSTCSTPRCSRSARRPSSTRATAACTRTCRTTSRASSPSPRLVGQLLEGEGVTAADVMARFDAQRPAAPPRRAASCSATRRRRSPSARSRSPTGSPRFLLGGRMDESAAADAAAAGRAARARPGPRRGRGDDRARCSRARADLPVVLAGPDAEALLATALRPPARRRRTCATSTTAT